MLGLQITVQVVAIALVLVVLYVAARAWARANKAKTAEPMGPHAMFDGGERYETADEKLSVEHDGPAGAGIGLLMAIVDALRARGLETNEVEPEDYGFMTVVKVGGEDVILQIGAGGDQEWTLFVRAPSGKVPMEVMDAVRSLEGIRNLTWSV